jgi:hypothetical protein
VASYEDRNGQRETYPRATFHFRLSTIQSPKPPLVQIALVLPHLRGQTNYTKGVDYWLRTAFCPDCGEWGGFRGSEVPCSYRLVLVF